MGNFDIDVLLTFNLTFISGRSSLTDLSCKCVGSLLSVRKIISSSIFSEGDGCLVIPRLWLGCGLISSSHSKSNRDDQLLHNSSQRVYFI